MPRPSPQPQSHYRTLGVSPRATADEIRAAYRKLAKLHHPDANPGSTNAEELFKRITAAYQVLGNPEKRRIYDLAHPADRQVSQPPKQPRDKTIRMKLNLTIEEAQSGGSKRVKYARETMCVVCDGKGESGDKPCPYCDGRSTVTTDRTESVEYPAGVRSGATLRKPGLGHLISANQVGDLLVTVVYKPHRYLRVAGSDLHYQCFIGLDQYIEGGVIKVPAGKGVIEHSLRPRFPDGETIRFSGKGLPAYDQYGAGSLIVTIRHCIPKKLSRKEMAKLEELMKMPGFNPAPDDKGCFPLEKE